MFEKRTETHPLKPRRLVEEDNASALLRLAGKNNIYYIV